MLMMLCTKWKCVATLGPELTTLCHLNMFGGVKESKGDGRRKKAAFTGCVHGDLRKRVRLFNTRTGSFSAAVEFLTPQELAFCPIMSCCYGIDGMQLIIV